MKYLNKTIEYGLYLLVFLLPVQTRWIIKAGELNSGYWEYGTYAVYGTDILLVLVLLLFIVYKFLIFNFQLTNFQTKFKSSIRWFIGGLLLAAMASVFFAVSKPLALYKLGWLILGAGLFWVVSQANYEKLKLIYAMFAGIFLQALLGIWQFLTQSSFASKWLGIALHGAAQLGTSVVEAVGVDGVGERWLRAYGGLDHPNVLGGMMVVGIILLIGEIMAEEKFINFQFPISNFQTIFNSKIFKVINLLFLIIFTAGLFFSFSRAAWLGLAVALTVMAIWFVARRYLNLQKSLAEIILIMGVVFFILFSQYQNLIISRLGGEGRLEIKSAAERLVSYQESRRLIKNNWLFGAGLGNYTLALSRAVMGQESFYYQPAHNVFLLVWNETGVAGLLFFVGLIIYLTIFNFQKIFKQCLEIRNWKLAIRQNDISSNGMINLLILAALFVLLFLDHWLWSLHFGVLFFWLIIGIIYKINREIFYETGSAGNKF